MTIKLEVGKAYRNRYDGIVVIVAENPGEIMQFVDIESETYRSDGSYNVDGYSTPSDLVEEFKYFRTQQEIFKYLTSGGYVANLTGEHFLVGFNAEGSLCRYDLYGVNLGKYSWYFDYPDAWTIGSTKSIEWYDNIPEQGVLCWCNEDGTEPIPRIIVKYVAGTVYPYRTKNGSSHAYAVPAKLDEITKYILENKNESN